MKKLIILLLLPLLIGASQTFYISTGGDDSTGDGSLSTSWYSPAKAQGEMIPDNGTIHCWIAAGTYHYTANQECDTYSGGGENERIYFIGDRWGEHIGSGGDIIFDFGGNAIRYAPGVDGKNFITFENIISSNNVNGHMIAENAANSIDFINCGFEGNGNTVSFYFISTGSILNFINCWITNSGSSASFMVGNGNTVSFIGCISYNSTTRAFYLDGSNHSGTFTMLNCIAINPDTEVFLFQDGLASKVVNNNYLDDTNNPSFDYNGTTYNTMALWSAATGMDTDSIAGTDAKFNDPANYDFRLQRTSPCGTTGIAKSSLPVKAYDDYYRRPRKVGSTEIGISEDFQPEVR